MDRRLTRSAKGLMQRIEAMLRAMLPRQARVVRNDGNSVWVRFVGENDNAPASQFVSTVIGVKANAIGWVFTLGGKKGLFIATGVPVGTDSFSHNGSPSAQNLTGVGTYATAGVIYANTLGYTGPDPDLPPLMPDITEGVWDVDILASAEMYRSVATGGSWLYVGNGTSAVEQKLRRLSPQTHSGTIVVNASLKGLTPTSIIDLRYTGYQTAGTTHVVNHGWQIKARRVG